MKLNSIKPARGSKPVGTRLGRGIGSGKGKTCGRGHKGQKARAGGYHKVGFEGGQMPLQRRLPKTGFRSRKSLFRQEIRLRDLNNLSTDVITLETLRQLGVVSAHIKYVKVVKSGELTSAVSLSGIPVTAGAKEAILAAGGKVEL